MLDTDKGVLETLGILDKEDVISNLIVYCLNNSESFEKRFSKLINQNGKVESIDTRTKIKDIGNPDIIIIYRELNVLNAVIIENKLKASEGKNQTERYSDQKVEDTLRSRYGETLNVSKRIFLTLYSDQPKCTDFDSLSYKEFYPLFDKIENMDKVYTGLIKDFQEQLKKFYSSKVRNEDYNMKILEKLEKYKDDYLDRGYHYFMSIINNINLDDKKLNITYERQNKRGRIDYIAKIHKETWSSDEAKRVDKKYVWNNKEPNFKIYVNVQYNTKDSDIKIQLHYTTNPYDKMEIVTAIGSNYLTEREKFKNELIQKLTNNVVWMVVNRSQKEEDTTTAIQIAKLRPERSNEYRNLSIGKFQELFKEDMIGIVKIIDDIKS
jgi:hypothetical protein